MTSLDERFSLLRRRVQWRIADALHAIDKATGSTLERRILCFTLDRLGADGTCSFLNEEPVRDLERGINVHVGDMEQRAAEQGIPSVYGEIRAERHRQIVKGRDMAHDDQRDRAGWLFCLDAVLNKHKRGWRQTWVKVGSVAVAAIEADDRKTARRVAAEVRAHGTVRR